MIYLLFLGCATIFTYGSGMFLERNLENKKKAKIIMLVTIFVDLFVLGWFKYINFFTGGRLESIFLPVGISFLFIYVNRIYYRCIS